MKLPYTEKKTSSILSYDIFNHNIHNCMIGLWASSNFMALSMCNKLNAQMNPSQAKIVQLDRINVKVVGELTDVHIRLDLYHRFHQTINIINNKINKKDTKNNI